MRRGQKKAFSAKRPRYFLDIHYKKAESICQAQKLTRTKNAGMKEKFRAYTGMKCSIDIGLYKPYNSWVNLRA